MSSVDGQFFKSLESRFPGGADSPWYVYVGLVFQAYDRMSLIGELWNHLLSETSSEDKQITQARKLREGLLKASALVGFPKGINACTALRKALSARSPALVAKLDKDPSLRQHLQRPEKDARGKAFFTKIYAQHTDRVLENMSLASGGDLSEFAINAIYGDLMAEESRLDAKETGLLEFLACFASGGSAWTQAKGHMYGSRNLGNGGEEIRAVMGICEAIEERLGIRAAREPREDWEWVAKAEGW